MNLSQNLVPNPSFETYTLCPNAASQIESSIPWTAATTTSSTDYYNSCSISSGCGVPYNVNSSFQYAHFGNAYAGLIIYHGSGLREYLQVQLTAPLVQNKTYYVEFYTNLTNGIWSSSCNNIAANLSIARPFTTNFGDVQSLTPHIILSGNPIVTDTLNWIKVSGCYTALGGEEYITIGNFFDNANTMVTGTTGIAYYYIDDVKVEEFVGTCVTSVNEFRNNINIDVYPNPTEGKLKLVSDDLKEMEHLTIKITDIVGKAILISIYKDELDISNFERGIYFLSIYKEQTLLGTKKIIKQ